MAESEELKLEIEVNYEKCCQTEDYDTPQTSRALKFPINTVHNNDDLKYFDFNSADEVRQRMKEIFGKGPKFDDTSDDIIDIKNAGDHDTEQKKLQKHLMCKDTETDETNRGDDNIKSNSNPLRYSTRNTIGTSRRRRGRPPKAGPSKKLKNQSISSMYLGKLTNVVFLKRFESGSTSDIDSLDVL